MGLAQKIVDEISDKMSDYESKMSSFMDRIGEFGDLFRVQKPRQSRNSKGFSNPRLTEYFRAATTLGSMMHRMMTAQTPNFEIAPMSVIDGSDQLLKIQGTLETQLQVSEYNRYLLMANIGVCAFGTQIVQEDYEICGINPFGRRMPITTFRPRSLFQVAFDRGAMSIDEADWLTTTDLISKAGLMNLAKMDDELNGPWNKKVLEFAAKEEIPAKEMNQSFLNRLNQLGYMNGEKPLRSEMAFYYGKLDAMNDGVEYICAVVNRKHLVRFHPNKNQTGKRNFRVGYWVEDPLAIDPLGLGIGHVAGGLHRSMDANRRRIQDGIAMMTYNMWSRLRTAGIDDSDLKIRPLQIVDMDERGGLEQLKMDGSGPTAGLKLEELLRAEFQAATGATPLLQGQISEASGTTASEAALAQNESVRNIAVKAELVAESFVRQHLMNMHINNVENIKAPFNINNSGYAGIVYPSDLKVDVDFRIKVTTDKDFRPKRLESILQLLQTLISTKSQHPQMFEISIIPLVQEAARALGVPADKLVMQNPMGAGNLTPMAMGGAAPMATPDASAMNGSTGVIDTAVGPVMGSVVQ